MEVKYTPIEGALIITPRVFRDERGYFKETYQQERYQTAGIKEVFIQDNFSSSAKGVLRGLHLQVQHPQGKLVQVMQGEIFDVCVDLRKYSPTFKQWFGVILNEQNHQQFYIPPGCAHGFYVISATTSVSYKCSDIYFPQDEKTLKWNDPEIAIEWPLQGSPIISAKDQQGLSLPEILQHI